MLHTILCANYFDVNLTHYYGVNLTHYNGVNVANYYGVNVANYYDGRLVLQLSSLGYSPSG